jgi:hypothetical protein
MVTALRILSIVAGGVLVLWASFSAILTFVVPRGTPVALTRWVFTAVATGFRGVALRSKSYETKDKIMALYAPFGLLLLPVAWLIIVYFGFSLIFLGLRVTPYHQALLMSASSLFTLGFVGARNLPSAAAVAIEAGLGLGLVAILISYLPSIYSSYSRREIRVTGLETFAGSPPSAETLLRRLTIVDRLSHTEEIWQSWIEWFADIEESHTSIPAIAFFRSPQPERSWVTAAGAVLDSASIVASTMTDVPHPEAALCIRSGYLSLRRVADFFQLPYDPDPSPDDPISISREEFEQVIDNLVEAGAPITATKDNAWRDFVGWRVNYDRVLLELASLTIAPFAPWSSDRSPTPLAFTGFGRQNRQRRTR